MQEISPKVRAFCEVAEREEYKWAWIDTCCIDKSSSAELSEAINSMFRYYTLALVCYAYLGDVPSAVAFDTFLNGSADDIRWFKRGWTLQELIAPRVVCFLSQTWEFLGSKAEFATLLEDITRIPASVLRLESDLTTFSIAQRMSWAADRQTTRPEDEAYCLLGIFDVNMPTLYGEGRKAFRRLQEEIMKQSPDTTLFAWGNRAACGAEAVLQRYTISTRLFADSPRDFYPSSDIRYTPRMGGHYPGPKHPDGTLPRNADGAQIAHSPSVWRNFISFNHSIKYVSSRL